MSVLTPAWADTTETYDDVDPVDATAYAGAHLAAPYVLNPAAEEGFVEVIVEQLFWRDGNTDHSPAIRLEAAFTHLTAAEARGVAAALVAAAAVLERANTNPVTAP